ncbi:hypothetical protein TNCV_1926901 [Trichonephila clavipes]|nr:hypothetical protein TNCV_1926901 [Trichonephila clavipes]
MPFRSNLGLCLRNFSIASKELSSEIFLQSRMKITWGEIRAVRRMLYVRPTKSCNMVLRCRHRVIQQQNARSEKPESLFFESPLSISTGCHRTM